MPIEYPKIDTLFSRGDNHQITQERRRPEFSIIPRWLATEKIDGTNVRITLHRDIAHPQRWKVLIQGRTDTGQLHPTLRGFLDNWFSVERMETVWQEGRGEYEFTLFGEGYGAKIQNGGDYRGQQLPPSFRLFDVLVSEQFWLSRANVEDVARKLHVEPVPLIDEDLISVESVMLKVGEGFASLVAKAEGGERKAEGIVAFTDPPLFNTKGQRVMWKLKTKDSRSLSAITSS